MCFHLAIFDSLFLTPNHLVRFMGLGFNYAVYSKTKLHLREERNDEFI